MAWPRTTTETTGGGTAAEESAAPEEADRFGRVSRTVGVVFRYLLLAATLVGIVALAVLLVFVTNDAVRPLSADPAWLGTASATMVVAPLAVAGWLVRRHPGEVRSGLAALGLLAVGILYAGGAAVVLTAVIPPVPWLAHVAALAVPAVVALAAERVDHRVPFGARVLAVVAVGALSLSVLPGAIQSLPVLPADWVVVLVTLGAPAAAVAAWYVQRRFEARGPTLVAGVGGFALAWGLGMAGVLIGINPAAMTALGIVGLLPFAVYVGCALYDRGRDATGVVFPFVVGGGVLATLAAERLIGLAGPNAWLTWDFLTSSLSAPATEAGIYPGVAGTILLMIVVILASFPVGVGAAVYLEEYATDTWFTRVIDVNISNLAGVPSVVYGLLGLGAFVHFGGLAPGTVLVGGMALSLLILPIVIINSREAIRAVPDSRRRAASGMGATRWQTVRTVVLPEAFPAILTGTILALGRARR
jgi:phosphate transport system permease protein